MQIPPALMLGCNTPHSVGVLSDWIEEQTGQAPDFVSTGWSDYFCPFKRIGDGDGYGYLYAIAVSRSGDGHGSGYGDMYGDGSGFGNGTSSGNGYGDGDGWTYGDGFGGGLSLSRPY